MAYTYLLDLYKILNARINEIDDTLRNRHALDPKKRQHLLGRRDCLKSIHHFLEDHFDQKLPRRLQGQSKRT
ncbi:MAG: hypothetical protein EX260_07410 [Desulfobulbaceae bacterium]|nr:MAG: hypothetical protein EX260_07410 [Desulfobulbaceae bacterium]